MTLALATLVLFSSSQPTPHVDHHPMNVGHAPFSRFPGKMDLVAIVRAVRRLPPILREYHNDEGSGHALFNVDEFVIVQSPALPVGTRIEALAHRRFDDSALPVLDPSARYLLLGKRQASGRVLFPIFEAVRSFPDEWAPATNLQECAAYGLFKTNATTVTVGATQKDTIFSSLADALSGADLSTGRQIIKAVMSSGLYDFRGSFVRQDTPFTTRLKSIAVASPIRLKVRIYGLLLDWHIVGSTAPYLAALLSTANDAEALAGDIPVGVLIDMPNESWGSDAEFEAMCATVAGARSTRLKEYLIRQMSRVPTQASQRRFAACLSEDDPILKRTLVEQFARWNADPTHDIRTEIVNGVEVVTNLLEMVAYWRLHFGLP